MCDVSYDYRHQRLEIPLMNLFFCSLLAVGLPFTSSTKSFYLAALSARIHCYYPRGLFVWWWNVKEEKLSII